MTKKWWSKGRLSLYFLFNDDDDNIKSWVIFTNGWPWPLIMPTLASDEITTQTLFNLSFPSFVNVPITIQLLLKWKQFFVSSLKFESNSVSGRVSSLPSEISKNIWSQFSTVAIWWKILEFFFNIIIYRCNTNSLYNLTWLKEVLHNLAKDPIKLVWCYFCMGNRNVDVKGRS